MNCSFAIGFLYFLNYTEYCFEKETFLIILKMCYDRLVLSSVEMC